MEIIYQDISIRLIRKDLQNIPQCSLPSRYSFWWYQPGDEKHWYNIQSNADKYTTFTPTLFNEEFGTDLSLLAERQCYLFDNENNAVGSVTAWFDNNFQGEIYGRIHWIAILPEYQGRGLANALMTVVCNRLSELGHDKAYLNTSTVRLPAINLYLKYGFVPDVSSDKYKNIWGKLKKYLKYQIDID
jgi:ribosomal protein S18 acetylase RimI-like enzyme